MSEHASNPLTDLSAQLEAAVAHGAKSTVAVYARHRLPGSGIAWAPNTIVTADHVLERDEQIEIGLPDGTRAAATLAGRDPGSDIAVLRTEASLTPIARAPLPGPGALALALGRPGSEGAVVSLGLISAVGGEWRTARGTKVGGYLRTDATFLPGLSGGPLLSAGGEAYGMLSSHLGRGAGLAIPAGGLSPIVEMLLARGKVVRGYLGIGSQPVRLSASQAEKAGGQQTALLITSVEPGTPASAAGFFVGDILAALGEATIAEPADLQAFLGPESVGQAVRAKLLRGAEIAHLELTIGERG